MKTILSLVAAFLLSGTAHAGDVYQCRVNDSVQFGENGADVEIPVHLESENAEPVAVQFSITKVWALIRITQVDRLPALRGMHHADVRLFKERIGVDGYRDQYATLSSTSLDFGPRFGIQSSNELAGPGNDFLNFFCEKKTK